MLQAHKITIFFLFPQTIALKYVAEHIKTGMLAMAYLFLCIGLYRMVSSPHLLPCLLIGELSQSD